MWEVNIYASVLFSACKLVTEPGELQIRSVKDDWSIWKVGLLCFPFNNDNNDIVRWNKIGTLYIQKL